MIGFFEHFFQKNYDYLAFRGLLKKIKIIKKFFKKPKTFFEFDVLYK